MRVWEKRKLVSVENFERTPKIHTFYECVACRVMPLEINSEVFFLVNFFIPPRHDYVCWRKHISSWTYLWMFPEKMLFDFDEISPRTGFNSAAWLFLYSLANCCVCFSFPLKHFNSSGVNAPGIESSFKRDSSRSRSAKSFSLLCGSLNVFLFFAHARHDFSHRDNSLISLPFQRQMRFPQKATRYLSKIAVLKHVR